MRPRRLPLLLFLLAGAACAAPPHLAKEDALEVHERGTGKTCVAERAHALIGRMRSDAVGREAQRLAGAGVLRWVPVGVMVTMEYRADRLNLHLDEDGRIVRVVCG